MKRKPVTAAWSKFFASQKTESLETYKIDGWKTPRDLADEMGITLSAARNMCQRHTESGGLEVKKIRVQTERGMMTLRIFRPVEKK